MPFNVLVNLVVQGRVQGATQATKVVSDFADEMQHLNQQISLWQTKRTGDTIFRGGDRIVSWFGGAVKGAANLESHITTLRLATGQTTEAVNSVASAIERIAIVAPQTQDQLFAIAINATKAGIAFGDLVEQTMQLAQFGVAVGQEMTEPIIRSLVRLQAQLGETAVEARATRNILALAGLGSVGGIEYILNAAQRAGPAAKSLGIVKGQFVSLLAALSVALPGARQAGNAVSTMFNNIAQPARFGAIAQLVGMTEAAVDAMMRDVQGGGPLEIFVKLLQAMKNFDPVSMRSAFRELGLTQVEMTPAFIQLVQGSDKLAISMDQARERYMQFASATGKADLLTDHFNQRLLTFNGTMQLIKGQLEKITTDAGKEFIGLAHRILDVTTKLAEAWEGWDSPMKKIISGMILFVGITGSVVGRIISITAQYALARAALAATLVSSGVASATIANTGLISGSLTLVRTEIVRVLGALGLWRTAAAASSASVAGSMAVAAGATTAASTASIGALARWRGAITLLAGVATLGLIPAFFEIAEAVGGKDGIAPMFTLLTTTLASGFTVAATAAEGLLRLTYNIGVALGNVGIGFARLFGGSADYVEFASLDPSQMMFGKATRSLFEKFETSYGLLSGDLRAPIRMNEETRARASIASGYPQPQSDEPSPSTTARFAATAGSVAAQMEEWKNSRACTTSQPESPVIKTTTTLKVDGETMATTVTKQQARATISLPAAPAAQSAVNLAADWGGGGAARYPVQYFSG